jgi:predicted acyl esterase
VVDTLVLYYESKGRQSTNASVLHDGRTVTARGGAVYRGGAPMKERQPTGREALPSACVTGQRTGSARHCTRRIKASVWFRYRMPAALGLLLGLALLAAPSVAAAEPTPFGHACKAQDGVRFCPTETLAQRVPTWDGVPLDADVTLPATGNGPWPTIVMLHGWGESKATFEASTPEGSTKSILFNNNVYFAQQGYAVLTYSARGWGNSCGTVESREEELPAGSSCEEGFIRLGDTRYEARDTEYLLGLLADEGIVKPRDIGVTGVSYGAGQSVELAYLKNRIRLPDGEFAPWKSPKGKAMEIKAAHPIALWSDLVDALQPNGRFLDTEIAPPGQSYEPIGVELQSYEAGLYSDVAGGSAYVAPEGKDEEANLDKWFVTVNAGEPWTAEDEYIAHQVYDYHQAYGMPLSGKPAALLLESGWTDDVFPVEQSLRIYNQVRALKGYVALMFGDVGHPPATNKRNNVLAFSAEGAQFFAAKLKHEGKPPKNGSVTAYTQTCPKSAPAEGPFTATQWSKLARHTLTLGSTAAQTFTAAGASATIATEFDPIAEDVKEEGGNVCKETKSELEPDTATYTMTSPGFLMMGLPTITAHVATTGPYGQIDARLWDVLPSGEEILTTRGVYRLTENQSGTITFQLHGNGYEFAKGDTVKLELLGRDSPYYHASNVPFTVEVSDLTAVLPTT